MGWFGWRRHFQDGSFRGWGRFSGRSGSGFDSGGKLAFEIFGGDFVEGAGGYFSGNAQFFGFGEHLFVVQAKLF